MGGGGGVMGGGSAGAKQLSRACVWKPPKPSSPKPSIPGSLT